MLPQPDRNVMSQLSPTGFYCGRVLPSIPPRKDAEQHHSLREMILPNAQNPMTQSAMNSMRAPFTGNGLRQSESA